MDYLQHENQLYKVKSKERKKEPNSSNPYKNIHNHSRLIILNRQNSYIQTSNAPKSNSISHNW